MEGATAAARAAEGAVVQDLRVLVKTKIASFAVPHLFLVSPLLVPLHTKAPCIALRIAR